MLKSILFFGDYPNAANPTLSVFFQTLIYAIADMGITCNVISPISVTKYRWQALKIPYLSEEKTHKGAIVRVYRPRYISFSSIALGKIDTHTWTVKAMRKAAEQVVSREALCFDVTYGHFINIGGVSACRIGSKYGIPSFVANGESDLRPSTYNYNSKYDLLPFKNCTGVISVSSKNKKELIERNMIDEDRIVVIPNAVDEKLFKPLDKTICREKLGFPCDKFIVGFVGSFSERKGSNRLFEAVKEISNCYMAFCGEGNIIPKSDKVVFCDSLPHSEIPVFLNAIDVFVLPTLNEGCCNAVLEAMACGVPIITSDQEFNYDILDSREALLIDPTDIGAIQEAIVTLMEDENKRLRLGELALNKSKLFTIDERARKIIEYMNHVRKNK